MWVHWLFQLPKCSIFGYLYQDESDEQPAGYAGIEHLLGQVHRRGFCLYYVTCPAGRSDLTSEM